MSKDQKNLAIHFLAGGIAGCSEAVVCHPLDTIKVRMQLRAATMRPEKSANFIRVGIAIAQKEGLLSLYKGLGAVVAGIVPKMAIRFSSFDFFRRSFANKEGKTSTLAIFTAGLCAGATESIAVVTPMDVIKIRLQSQRHSMTDVKTTNKSLSIYQNTETLLIASM
jgi:solute carrier family 25 citrate transporter 1